MPRTGTVFLSELLNLHPDVAPPEPLVEDYLLAQSEALLEFADEMTALWERVNSLPPERQPDLRRALGDGLLSMLARAAGGGRVGTKTPRGHHPRHFLALFSDAAPARPVPRGRAAV